MGRDEACSKGWYKGGIWRPPGGLLRENGIYALVELMKNNIFAIYSSSHKQRGPTFDKKGIVYV